MSFDSRSNYIFSVSSLSKTCAELYISVMNLFISEVKLKHTVYYLVSLITVENFCKCKTLIRLCLTAQFALV